MEPIPQEQQAQGADEKEAGRPQQTEEWRTLTVTLYHGDCLVEMGKIPDSSVDLVVTSPPYNLRNTSGGGFPKRGGKWQSAGLRDGYNGYDDNMPHDQYVEWQRKCLSEMMRVLSEDGAIFYNHKWRVQNGLLQDRSDIVEGYPVRQVIIWQRDGGVNFNDGYFLPTYEVIYLICRPKFRLAPKANAVGDIWRISPDRGNPHPAPFPLDLARRCVDSTNAQTVLDPFTGSGTTGVACVNTGRSFIGIEKDEGYFHVAEKRITEAQSRTQQVRLFQ